MAKKNKKLKRSIDEQLLDSIFTIEREWKQIQSIVEKSIDPTEAGFFRQNISEAKYLFLLREARRRKISAIRYNK
ncbi:YaaL family protein [Virgibacillus sp. JSM 102003]|uniref:YaaL family protein n=1 Tax=Virgibacillus sp. JSM 102003 TaxID=1562108 RepID=UPI0035BFD404